MSVELRPALRRALLALLTAAGLLAGCGLGPGPTPRDVGLLVTRDFGAHVLRSAHSPRVRGSETAMSLLMRNDSVGTRYGGGFVESIDGHSGGQRAGRPFDWFYYVNGVEAARGAAGTVLHAGDQVWWDLHDWSQTEDVPAVVGAFPEPFLHGLGGRRLPVRVECAEVQGEPCRTVIARLRAAGVPAAISTVAPGEEPAILRVLVGAWPALAGDPAAQGVERGPAASGVYARISPDGTSLALLDADGRSARTLSAGAGLVAATRYGQSAPVWLVTGTDPAGVAAAARAFAATTLRDRFAVALTGAGETLGLPR
jgi:hypothetical protein